MLGISPFISGALYTFPPTFTGPVNPNSTIGISLFLSPFTHSDPFKGGASDGTPLPSLPWQVWQTEPKRVTPLGYILAIARGSLLFFAFAISSITFLSLLLKTAAVSGL